MDDDYGGLQIAVERPRQLSWATRQAGTWETTSWVSLTEPHSSERPERRQTLQSGCTASSQFVTVPHGSTLFQRSTRPSRSITQYDRSKSDNYCISHTQWPTEFIHYSTKIRKTAWVHCTADWPNSTVCQWHTSGGYEFKMTHTMAIQYGSILAHRSTRPHGSTVPHKS